MAADNPPANDRTCPRCGAELTSATERCWLCSRELGAPAEGELYSNRSKPAAPVVPSDPTSYSLSSLLLFITLAAVGLGVITIAPGLGVPFVVVAFVVWVRTATTVEQLRRRGKAVTTLQKVQMFLASFGVAAVTLLLVVVAGCAALCSACFVLFSLGGPAMQEMLPWGLGLGVLAVASIFATIKMIAYGRRRRERELSD